MAGLNKGGMDTFMDNLPGFPDNIRPSSSGGYWVAMSAVRPNPGFSMLDFLSQRPWIKKLIFKVKQSRGYDRCQSRRQKLLLDTDKGWRQRLDALGLDEETLLCVK